MGLGAHCDWNGGTLSCPQLSCGHVGGQTYVVLSWLGFLIGPCTWPVTSPWLMVLWAASPALTEPGGSGVVGWHPVTEDTACTGVAHSSQLVILAEPLLMLLKKM